MKRVLIISPYRGNVDKNLAYARHCLLDSIKRGEAPFASHLLYTQVLNDQNSEERATGLECEDAWLIKADLIAAYIDHNWSEGMQRTIRNARLLFKPWEERSIFKKNRKHESHFNPQLDPSEFKE